MHVAFEGVVKAWKFVTLNDLFIRANLLWSDPKWLELLRQLTFRRQPFLSCMTSDGRKVSEPREWHRRRDLVAWKCSKMLLTSLEKC
jgi:hypothetical protein